MFNRYRIIKGLSKSSSSGAGASPTDLFIVKDTETNKEYVFKVFIEEYTIIQKNNRQMYIQPGPDTIDLIHEIRMYKTLRESIIIPYNVRNLLCIHGDGKFVLKDYVQLVTRSTSLTELQALNNVVQNTKSMLKFPDSKQVVITESNPVSSIEAEFLIDKKYIIDIKQPILYHAISTPRLNPLFIDACIDPEHKKATSSKEFMNYIFLVLVTEFILSGFGFNHNDLHAGNIYLDKTYFGPSEHHKRVYLLVYNTHVLLINNEYIPYIYDFDRSIQKNKSRKSLRDDNFIAGGNCPRFHPKRDFVRTLCMVYQFIQVYNLKHIPDFSVIQYEILNNLMSSPKLRKIIEKDESFMCFMRDSDNVSVSCKDVHIDTVKKREDILDWALKKTSYSYFTFEHLEDVEKRQTSSPYYKQVTKVLNEFKEGMNPTPVSVYANIQFVYPQDFLYWDNDDRRSSFVNRIYQQLVKLS